MAAGSLFRNLLPPDQSRKSGGNRQKFFSGRVCELAMFFSFQTLPVGLLLLHTGVGLSFENMRMAVNHLPADLVHHIIDGELASFLANLGMENNLEERVSQLLNQMAGITGGCQVRDGLVNFVGFFQQMRLSGFMGLRLVPGTAVRSSKCGDDCQKFLKLKSIILLTLS